MNSDTVGFCDEIAALVNEGRCRALVAVYRDPGKSMAWYEQKAELAHNYMSRFVSDFSHFFVVQEMDNHKSVTLTDGGHRVAETILGLSNFDSDDFGDK